MNRKFATHFFGDKSPLGRRIGFGGGPKTKLDMEIVGVTEDSLYEGPREGVHRQVFIPKSGNGSARGRSSAAVWPLWSRTAMLCACV